MDENHSDKKLADEQAEPFTNKEVALTDGEKKLLSEKQKKILAISVGVIVGLIILILFLIFMLKPSKNKNEICIEAEYTTTKANEAINVINDKIKNFTVEVDGNKVNLTDKNEVLIEKPGTHKIKLNFNSTPKISFMFFNF